MVFSSIQKQVNGLPNDCIWNIIDYVGDKLKRQLYLETFKGETLTSIKCSFTSVSCAELYLGGKGDDVMVPI